MKSWKNHGASLAVVGLLFLFASASVCAKQGPDEMAPIARLTSPETSVRRAAAQEIMESKEVDFETALPSLLEALHDRDGDVRYFVAVTLYKGVYGSQKNAHVLQKSTHELIESIRDEDPRVRQNVLYALSLSGGQIPDAATPGLIELLKDSDENVRRAAVMTLGQTNTNDHAAAEALLSELESEANSRVRGEAARALARVGRNGSEKIEALIEALGDADRFVRESAVRALGEIGPEAIAAAPALSEIANDPTEDEGLRQNATAALRRLGSKPS